MQSQRRLSSSSKSLSSSPESDLSADRQRLKKWAPKVRTGCTTCRIRRVKCDETKPCCNKCKSAGRKCEGSQGYGAGGSSIPKLGAKSPTAVSKRDSITHGGAGVSREVSGATALVRRRLDQSTMPQLEIKHFKIDRPLDFPDKDFMEACHHYIEVVWPSQTEDMDRHITRPLNLATRYRPGFNMAMITSRIDLISKANNVLPRNSDMPYIPQLWADLYRFTIQNILDLNSYLEEGSISSKELAFRRMCDLVSSELTLLGTSWQPHMAAFLNLVRLEKDISVLRSLWVSKKAMQFMLCNTVISNTTSPADSQIWQVYMFTTDELRTMYSFEVSSETPCPTDLFLDIIYITRLRTRLKEGASFETIILPAAKGILTHVDAFSLEDWTEPYEIPDTAEFDVMGRVFKCTIKLYGLLSLFSAEQESQLQVDEFRRHVVRDQLVELVREATLVLKSKSPLAWPLSVLAIALVDGKAEDKALVESILLSTSRYDKFNVPQYRVRLFREFWASGKTAWDECYGVPLPPLS